MNSSISRLGMYLMYLGLVLLLSAAIYTGIRPFLKINYEVVESFTLILALVVLWRGNIVIY